MKRKKRQLDIFEIPRSKLWVPNSFFKVKPIPKNLKKIKRPKPLNNFNFLNNAVPKRPVAPRNNGKMSFFTPVKMQPPSYMIKESINQKRKLNDWGDADLDGSPNKFDCNPRNPAEDGVLARALGMLTRDKYGQSAEEYAAEKNERKVSKFTVAAINLEKEEREARAARKAFGNLAEERISEISRGENIKLREDQIEKLRAQARGLIRQEQESPPPSFKERVKEHGRRFVETLASPETRRVLELNKEIKRLQEAKKPTIKLRQLKEKIQKGIGKKRTQIVAGILSATTPLGAVPEIRRLAPTTQPSAPGSGSGKRGRPKGTLRGGYVIDGVTLSEAEFQQIRSAENKKRKTMDMPKVPLGARQFNTVKQAVSRTETPQAVQRTETPQAMQDEFEEEGIVEDRTVEEERVEQPRRPTTIQEAQAQEQRDDNILHAPNFQKGELTQTAGAFQDDPQYNILNAPNFQKGALRRVGETEETPTVVVGERPNPNPYGTEYTDIDPGSGRTIIHRRPQEKWVTGEAL